jgi:microcompartment protein CcmL/EutN
MVEYALGLIETKGLIGAIEAADAACKAAEVTLIGKEKITAAMVTIKLVGEVAAVKSAVEAGAAAAARVGELLSTHVIPRPAEDIRPLIHQHQMVVAVGEEKPKQKETPASAKDHSEDATIVEEPKSGATAVRRGRKASTAYATFSREELSAEETTYLNQLEAMSVHQLRQLARHTEGLTIFGREISRADKQQLIDQLMTAFRKK